MLIVPLCFTPFPTTKIGFFALLRSFTIFLASLLIFGKNVFFFSGLKDFKFFTLISFFWTSKGTSIQTGPGLPFFARKNAFSSTYLTSFGFLIISAYLVRGFTIGIILISAVPNVLIFFNLVLCVVCL